MKPAFQPYTVLQHKPDRSLGWIAAVKEKPFSKLISKFTTPRYALLVFEPFELSTTCKTSLLQDLPEAELENWTTELQVQEDLFRPASFDEGLEKCSKGCLLDYKMARVIRNRFLEMPYIYWRHSCRSGFCEDQAESLAILALQVADLFNREYPRHFSPVNDFDYTKMECA